MKDEKFDIENKKEPDFNKKKKEMSTFVLSNNVIFYVNPQGDQQAKKL